MFRPKLSDAEREQLLTSLRSTIGAKYNTVRVFSFIFRLAMKTYFGISNPLSPSPVVYHPPNTHPFLQQITGRDENGVICTDAILPRLLAVSKDFRENVGKLRLDANALKSWSINDVLVSNKHGIFQTRTQMSKCWLDLCSLFHVHDFKFSLG